MKCSGKFQAITADLPSISAHYGKTLALKPAGLTFEEAAAILQAGVIALQGIRDKGQVKSGQKDMRLRA